MGLVTPGMVNVRGLAVVKVPAVIVTVNTPAAKMVAVPAAPEAGAVNARLPGEATASPDPLKVMMILPVEGMLTAGVRVTVMVTPPAPLTALLRVTAGPFVPSVLVVMATKVPVLLAPIIAPALSVVAAAMVVD